MYRDFVYGTFAQHTAMIVIAIACGQIAAGSLAAMPHPWRTLGYSGVIAFLLAICRLGVGSAFPSPLVMAGAVAVLMYRDRFARRVAYVSGTPLALPHH